MGSERERAMKITSISAGQEVAAMYSLEDTLMVRIHSH